MGHHDRGMGDARSPGTLFLVTLLLAACSPTIPPSPTPAPTPAASPRLPTPVPTAPTTPAPSQSAAAASASLVVRMTACSHVCGPEPGTTILAGGRVIWADPFGRALEARLTPEAVQRVREALDATGALGEDGEFAATLRPGAEPLGRGATLIRFERDIAERRVTVTSGSADDYADEPDLWIVPPEIPILTDLAERLRDPLAWLGVDAFTSEPRPYEPDQFLVQIDLYAAFGDPADYDVDVDDVTWPFGEPIESAGQPVELPFEGPASRCLLVDADTAQRTAAAEAAAGSFRDLRLWVSGVDYGWRRAHGFVGVITTPLLPHERGTCEALLLTPP
jgi:hypothetical protein